MTSNLEEQKLTKLISEVIAEELKAHGETKPGAIGPRIRAKYPNAAEQYGAALFDGAVSRKAASQLKSWFTVSLAGEKQLAFPGIPADVLSEIPPTIAVPDEDGEARHILLSRVSVGEFRSWVKMLGEQIEADRRKHRAGRFIEDKIKGVSPEYRLSDVFSPASQAAE